MVTQPICLAERPVFGAKFFPAEPRRRPAFANFRQQMSRISDGLGEIYRWLRTKLMEDTQHIPFTPALDNLFSLNAVDTN